MDNYRFSHLIKQSPTKIQQRISPSKYAKDPYLDAYYTPGKLADGLIFRQAGTMRKAQQVKIGQFEALNSFMQERLSQLVQQRNGIEQTLTQQIVMYKKMIGEMQIKHEQRLRQIQKRYYSELQISQSQKDQLIKNGLNEKQALIQKNNELEQQNKLYEEQMNNLNSTHQILKKQLDNAIALQATLNQKIALLDKLRNDQIQKSKMIQQEFKKKLQHSQNIWNKDLQNLMDQKNAERQTLERMLKTEIQKLDNLRICQSMRKNQELKQVSQLYEQQIQQITEILNDRQQTISQFSKHTSQIETQNEHLLHQKQIQLNELRQLNQQYHKKITILLEQNQSLDQHIQTLTQENIQQRERLNLEMSQLQKQLEISQINNLRERDRFQYNCHDMQKQIVRLKGQEHGFISLIAQNQKLTHEIRHLRDLLLESSFQIERSKQEIVRLSIERENTGRMSHNLQLSSRRAEPESLKWRNTLYSTRLYQKL